MSPPAKRARTSESRAAAKPKQEREQALTPVPAQGVYQELAEKLEDLEPLTEAEVEEGEFSDLTMSEMSDPSIFDEEETPSSPPTKTKTKPTQFSGGYDSLKTSSTGQFYSGMSVGRSHAWDYEPGVWQETKEEPDRWSIDYEVMKTRKGRKAPVGTGAPVGTEYHWFIVGHQHVKKIDANTYTTHLTGHKYKLAHKRAGARAWSVPSVKGQRARELELLDDAKLRVEGLPPVLGSEKVKVDERGKGGKGQMTLEGMFGSGKGGGKRKRVDGEE